MAAPTLAEQPTSVTHRRHRRRAPGRAGTCTTRREVLAVVALVAFAAATRWPYLLRLPHFTDEIGEVRWALRIWRGEEFPLTGQVPYFGPYQHYLLAAVLKLTGLHVVTPRLLVLIFGALTVALTYLLGRDLAGPRTGLLAAALLATLPQHIVVNSHVAWQNSTTPFYSTLALYALLRALRAPPPIPPAPRPSPLALHHSPWFLLAGLAYGVALGTHLGLIVLAPALAGTVALAMRRARSWAALRSPGPYLGLVGALLVYSPVLIANARDGWRGYWRMRGRDYAFEQHPSWESYRHNLQNLLFELARDISNPFRLPERRLDYLTSPYMLIAVTLTVAGLLLLARRGRWLPLLAVAATALILPRFNHAYGVEGDRYLVTGRYVAFLLPPLLIGMAAGALALADRALALVPRRWRGLALRDGALVLVAGLIVALVLYPLTPLRRYYADESGRDPANATFLATLAVLNAERGPRTPILLDGFFNKVNLGDGAEALDILDILMTLDNIPHRIVDDPGPAIGALAPTLDLADREALPLIVMPRDRCWPLQEEYPLQRISNTLLLNELFRYYAVYRYVPPGEPAACRTAEGK